MKVGILGGTFDPVHNGHLLLAECAREQLSLDEVLFVPAGNPWRKSERAITPAEHRLAMLRLAIEGNDAFGISDIELRREGPSYTADTLEALAGERLDDAFWFIVGADALADIRHWREPERIARHARIGAAPRSGTEMPHDGVIPSDRIDGFDCPGLDISSTDIRARVSSGRSIRYMLPDAVCRYIEANRLYR
ncbi:MAG TPA: nicotinate-nucleotide adenylyltransferase [Gemmatimonadaceae bacterium]